MANRVFKNIGIRRDLNFSDIENPRLALSNLLNDLVTENVETESFTADDLDCIQNISTTNVTNSDFRALKGVTVQRTTLNELGEAISVPALPLITVKNQLDNIINVTRDPPYFNGGDGLTAKFWDQTNISGSITKSSNGAQLFIGEPQILRSEFWDYGYFEFSNKLDQTLGGSNGGIQWEGWYIPDASGTSTFTISTSGFFMLELENVQGNLEVVKNIHTKLLQVTVTQSVSSDTTVYVSNTDSMGIAVGAQVNPLTLTGVLVDSVGPGYFTTNIPVTFSQNESVTISLEDKFGSESYYFVYEYVNLEKYVPKKIRMSLWFPGNSQYFYKLLDVNLATLNRSTSNLPFWYLYSVINTEGAAGFKSFYDSRLLANGGTIGPETVSSSSQYNTLQSIAPLKITYIPPVTYSNILKKEYTYSIIDQSNVLAITSTSPFTSSIEIGNIAISTGLPKFSKVTDIAINTVVILDKKATQTTSSLIKFIDHRGLVDYFDATSAGTVVTVADTSNLRKGMIVITLTNTGYIRIVSVDSATQFTTSVALGFTGTQQIFVYKDVGLTNQTLEVFCTGVFGKETTQYIASGNQIVLNNVTDIILGQVVQYSPYIPDGTTVTNIDAGTNTITISQNITNPIVSGATIVFSPSGTTQNKETCVIPLNTAPPFSGTPTGLLTAGNFRLTNGVLTATNIKINNATVVVAPTTKTLDRLVNLTIGGTVYKIMGSSS